MKVTFETDDPKEINRLTKSLDMACFIFDVLNNSWRKFENSEIPYEPIYREIREIAETYNINPDDLIE